MSSLTCVAGLMSVVFAGITLDRYAGRCGQICVASVDGHYRVRTAEASNQEATNAITSLWDAHAGSRVPNAVALARFGTPQRPLFGLVFDLTLRVNKPPLLPKKTNVSLADHTRTDALKELFPI
jgi:hypothetical protein